MSLISNLLDENESLPPVQEPVPGPLLAVDIGSIHTRAVLLDVVEGVYRLIGKSRVPTTAAEPWNDVLVGVHHAVQQIAEATGRILLDEAGDLIIPEAELSVGVDNFVATTSAGQPANAILIGLVPEVSLESGRRAADSIYLSLADIFSLSDTRSIEQQMDALLQTEADVVFIVGGTDGGATELMTRYIDTVLLAFSLMDGQNRPPLLYAGNKELAESLLERGQEAGIQVLVADNVRPTLETEYLASAQAQLASLFHRQKAKNTPGFEEIGGWMGRDIVPTAHGFGRLIHLLGELKGHNVLGIDLGSKATTIAASIGDQHYLNVFGQMGMGHTAKEALEIVHPENVARWLSFSLSHPDELANAIWNKSLYPHTIPFEMADVEIQYALAREIIRWATYSARQSWRGVPQRGLLPVFGTILLSGSTLCHAGAKGWGLLTVADALQPIGITHVLSDQFGLATGLGAIAPEHPALVVQLLETDAFQSIGTLISPMGKPGGTGGDLLSGQLRLQTSDSEIPFEVKLGGFSKIALGQGQQAELAFRQQANIEGVGRKQKPLVMGGELGVIFDARGRPLRLNQDHEQRQRQVLAWRDSVVAES